MTLAVHMLSKRLYTLGEPGESTLHSKQLSVEPVELVVDGLKLLFKILFDDGVQLVDGDFDDHAMCSIVALEVHDLDLME